MEFVFTLIRGERRNCLNSEITPIQANYIHLLDFLVTSLLLSKLSLLRMTFSSTICVSSYPSYDPLSSSEIFLFLFFFFYFFFFLFFFSFFFFLSIFLFLPPLTFYCLVASDYGLFLVDVNFNFLWSTLKQPRYDRVNERERPVILSFTTLRILCFHLELIVYSLKKNGMKLLLY